MFYSLKGKIQLIKSNFVVIEAAGLGYKVFLSGQSLKKVSKTGRLTQLFLRLYWKEETIELFGFLTEEELEFFEILNTVSGVGPKTALNILGLAPVKSLKLGISQGKTEALVKAFGIGRKTAERLVWELKNKIKDQPDKTIGDEEDIFEVLVGFGFSRKQAREAITKVSGQKFKTAGERIKAALKEVK